ncbi:MAG: hypothetical protein HOF38_05020 [Elusimicrobiaceae bacterium]|jgi:Holliday junction DNA helicase RuvA|nr:hypothetical protein [Elusimicrobiaceae bacterium]MBT3955498.1 hypothetical protein [Elusimicrobiaceae bacterium]MBT4008546.1 hypothetical protein [Elusimicrobiaceae bacterium]MBT4402381.1 hypothetical protein [Elusimicrobiaceae bacterium]MBT4440337.1 hypothetical protein [Elusimicrobiaceae bacterium]
MIAYLKGEAIEVNDENLIVSTGNVGYIVNMAPLSLAGIKKGQEVELFINESMSPYDGATLYGFASKEEQQLFNIIKSSVPKTGPKKAIEYLNKALKSIGDFHNAIIKQDPQILTGIFGFTSKTAEKLINSLKDKMSEFSTSAELKIKIADSGISIPHINDVTQALTTLGYSGHEVRKSLEKIDTQNLSSKSSIQDVLGECFKILKK